MRWEAQRTPLWLHRESLGGPVRSRFTSTVGKAPSPLQGFAGAVQKMRALILASPIGLAITMSSHLSDAFGENEFVRKSGG